MKIIIVGASGQIGYAFYQLLIRLNTQIVLISRTELPYFVDNEKVKHHKIDRYNTVAFEKVLSEGADWIIDLIAFTVEDVEQVLKYQDNFCYITLLSSSSVYSDFKGRSLDEAGIYGFPEFEEPICESQQTVLPGKDTYSTKKIAIEQTLIQKATIPFSILRPCAIYGNYSHHPREWWIIKRILDKRPYIPITYKGESVFHTTSASLIAEIGLFAMKSAQNHVLNIGDKRPISVLGIIEFIANYMGYTGEIIPIDFSEGKYQHVGVSPWSTPKPFVLNTTLSERILLDNDRTLLDYKSQIVCCIDQLSSMSNTQNWESKFYQLAAYPYKQFNYALEDKIIR